MPDPNQTHKPFWGYSKHAQELFSRAGSAGSQHLLGPLLVCYSDSSAKEDWGCPTALQGFHLLPQDWIEVLMLPPHSNALEPQESLPRQGKQKSSLYIHNFLKIVSSNPASSHLYLFVFSYPLCSALSWRAAALQSSLLFQEGLALNYWQPHDVVTGTTCKGDLAPWGDLKCSHWDLWQTVSGSSLEVTCHHKNSISWCRFQQEAELKWCLSYRVTNPILASRFLWTLTDVLWTSGK